MRPGAQAPTDALTDAANRSGGVDDFGRNVAALRGDDRLPQNLQDYKLRVGVVFTTLAAGNGTMLNRVKRLFSNKRLAAAICGDADQLRDARLWGPAAQLYKSFLELRPRHAAIWVQLGHCQKESGLLDEADVSYGRAAAIAPNVADIWLQIGHLRKVQGRISEAAVNYAKALTKEPTLMPARLELERLGFAPSDMARLIAEPGSPAAMARLHELSERPSAAPSQIEPGQMEEVRARLDDAQQRISTQSGHIEHLLAFSRHIERLLELTSTVKALGFAMKRQEGRIESLAARFAEIEERLAARFGDLERLLEMNGNAPVAVLASGSVPHNGQASQAAVHRADTEIMADRPNGQHAVDEKDRAAARSAHPEIVNDAGQFPELNSRTQEIYDRLLSTVIGTDSISQ